MDGKLLRKRITASSIAITGILYLIAGIFMVVWVNGVPPMMRTIVLIYTIILSFFGVLSCLSNFKIMRLIQAILPLIFGLIFANDPSSISKLFTFLLGLYIVLISLVKFIDFIVLNANKTPGRIMVLLNSIIMGLIAIPLIWNPSMYMNRAILIASIFFVFYGLTYLSDFFVQIAPSQKMIPIKQRVRITLPIIFTSLIPKKMVNHVNNLLSIDHDKKLQEESFKEEVEPDLEILIHASETGFGAMGHVDFILDDTVYSYGNYDFQSLKFFESIGDGVLLEIPGRNHYIQFRLTDVGNSIFAFGIKLDESQKERVRKVVSEIKTHTYSWDSLAKRQAMGEVLDETPKDYASRLYRETEARMYKFNDTSFKAYFVMSTNCVKLVDKVIRSAGLVAASPNGILTPGAYYEFFERQYRFKNSVVISKRTYNPKGIIQHETFN